GVQTSALPIFATAEIDKQFHGRLTATLLQDFTQKTFAGLCVEDAFFFKTGEGIGGQDFGPFVTVVTSSVTTGKYVTEAVLKTIECRSEEHTSELQSRENLVCRLLLEK